MHNVPGAVNVPGPAPCSQFFVTLADETNCLDWGHTAFGQVTEGADVLSALSSCDVDAQNSPVRVTHPAHHRAA